MLLNQNVFYDCIQSFSLINQHQLKLIWVPGYQDIEYKENTYKFVIKGSSLDITLTCNDVVNIRQLKKYQSYDQQSKSVEYQGFFIEKNSDLIDFVMVSI